MTRTAIEAPAGRSSASRARERRTRAMFLLPLLVLAAASLMDRALAGPDGKPPSLRLPGGVRPLRYAIDLSLSPGEEPFTGIVDLEIEIERPLDLLWLNADNLTVSEATLTLAGAPAGDSESALHPRIVPGGEDFVGLALASPVGPGRARLHLVFSGQARVKETRGIFRRKEGADWYLYTQFEEIGARRAFPCFDEPRFKVPWQLTLRVPKGLTAVSNAPLLQDGSPGEHADRDDEGRTAFRFAPTRPLPSYLVAFAVGPLEFAEGPPSGSKKVPFRVVTPRGQRDQAAYAVAATPQLLTLLETYFGTPYPFDKIDIIAVPLFGGAMENPGLITFSRGLLLTTPQEETLARQRRFSTVMAHELAHMWFGDFVTMDWWDDIWLNESFANWMENKIVEQWKPGWDVPLQRVRRRNRAMETDSLISARRVRQPIESKDDIANAFDAITYDKGSAVLAMFEGWIGSEAFRKGVQRYLSRHAWGNANAEDFFAALSEDAQRDVAPAFRSFLDQGGVPMVTGTLACSADEPPVLRLDQSRYLPSGSKGSDRQTWRIPICIRYGTEQSGEHRRCLLLENASTDLPLEGSCPTWLVPNEGMSGYYRALVTGAGGSSVENGGSRENAGRGKNRRRGGTPEPGEHGGGEELAGDGKNRGRGEGGAEHGHGEASRTGGGGTRANGRSGRPGSAGFAFTARLFAPGNTRLTPAERAGTLDDLSALSESGEVPMADVLSLVPDVVREGSRSSLESAARITKELWPHRVPASLQPSYQRFIRKLFGPKARELGFATRSEDSENDRLVRPTIVSLVAENGEDARLQKQAAALAIAWLRDRRAISADMVDVVLSAAARHGNEALFERFHEAARRATDRNERRHLLEAMASFLDPAIVQKRLQLILTDEFESRDAMTLLWGSLPEPGPGAIALAFVEKNYDALAGKMSKDAESRLATVGERFCDPAHRAEIEGFFKERTTRATGGPRVLAEILEGIDLCIARTEAQQPSVSDFLKRY